MRKLRITSNFFWMVVEFWFDEPKRLCEMVSEQA
jgi:hypothetical protein